MTSDVPALELSVVLPAHNEIALLGSTVANLVAGLAARKLAFEVIVVENGSSDGTLRLARLLAAQIPEVRVLAQARGDYGAALEAGIRAAGGRLVATFDVDYYDLSFLDEAIALVDSNGAAIVVASKRAEGASDRRPLPRRAITFVFTDLLQRTVGLGVSDAHGMKLLDRERVGPLVDACRLRASMFDVELVVRTQRAGLELAELPAVVVERRPPRSSVLRRAPKALVGIAKLRWILNREGLEGRTERRPPGTARRGRR